MKKIIKSSLCIMLALFGVQANAQTSFTSDDLNVWADDVVMTTTESPIGYLNIYMTDLTRQYSGFQMEITVPKEISIHKLTSGRTVKYDATLNQYRFDGLGHSVTINMPNETTIKLSVIDYTNNAEFYSDAIVDDQQSLDINGDGVLSLADMTCLTEKVNGHTAYDVNNKPITNSVADVNSDGSVDTKDIEYLESVLLETVEKLIKIGLVADDSMESGVYDVVFKTSEMITKESIGYSPTSEVTCKVIVNGGSTRVQELSDEESGNEEYYGVDGIKRSSVKNGVNIIRSGNSAKKVVKK